MNCEQTLVIYLRKLSDGLCACRPSELYLSQKRNLFKIHYNLSFHFSHFCAQAV